MVHRTLPHLSVISVTFILILTLLSSGCTDTGKIDEETVIGTVVHVENDSGVYIIQAENGTCYAPVNLDEAYRVDGMMVGFRGVIPENDGVPESPCIPIEIHYIGTYVPPGANATFTLEKLLP
ncbi:hypothetical protein F8E02_10385 [Methanoculleus sp. Wushi-C6]|uniref:Uncharacterized protein n=1 Tax=Methanoculleus caldifontis TaxID=2651577 RepID=A0ABU3X2V9_9EURY|nr:hypothetical protein [Methanoculleus sp. Wushi-C6]MDV2482399.1 hypothetical protein [Methanoculleus sp. Wushi-C6]